MIIVKQSANSLNSEVAEKTATFVRANLGLQLDMVDDDNDPFWEQDDDLGSEEEEEM